MAKETKRRLLKFLDSQKPKLTLKMIRDNPSINPLPVGRQNLEKLVKVGEITDSLEDKLNEFFNKL